MPDNRFHSRAGPFTLAVLAAAVAAELHEGADPDAVIEDVAPLETAGRHDLSFLDNPRYLGAFASSSAGACVVAPRHADRAPAGMALLLSDRPYMSYARIAQSFYPAPAPEPGVAPSAVVDATARVGEGCRIGASAVIEAGAEIGRRCLIGANAVIGRAVQIGDDVTIGPCAVLSHCVVGDRVYVHRGACIGQEGFGFAPDPAGHVAVPQLGRVLVGDDAQIGANTTIDRGSGGDTVIGPDCRIDNLVQIAHNVELGRGAVIVAQVGISGSCTIGDHAMLGGQSGVIGHLTVGAGALISAKAGVMRDVPPGAKWGGAPALPIGEWHRQTVSLRRLARRRARDHE